MREKREQNSLFIDLVLLLCNLEISLLLFQVSHSAVPNDDVSQWSNCSRASRSYADALCNICKFEVYLLVRNPLIYYNSCEL